MPISTNARGKRNRLQEKTPTFKGLFTWREGVPANRATRLTELLLHSKHEESLSILGFLYNGCLDLSHMPSHRLGICYAYQVKY